MDEQKRMKLLEILYNYLNDSKNNIETISGCKWQDEHGTKRETITVEIAYKGESIDMSDLTDENTVIRGWG